MCSFKWLDCVCACVCVKVQTFMATLQCKKVRNAFWDVRVWWASKLSSHFGPIISFLFTHFISVCLTSDVSLRPTEPCWFQQPGGGLAWNFWHMIHFWRRPFSRCLLFSPLGLLSEMEEKNKETRVSRNAALNLPPALCRPAGGTVRIQNTEPQPKPRNAPLSPSPPPFVSCASVM